MGIRTIFPLMPLLIRTDADTLDGDVFFYAQDRRARVQAISSIALPAHPQHALRARTHHPRVFPR
jgi:hypothetical protein